MKVLIIEDDHDTRRFVAGGLKAEGHTVDEASDGREGLYLASGEAYDAIIVDRMLPIIDGTAILQTLRKSGIQTPVLMLSALGEVDHRIEGLHSGADDYLAKPFSFKELSARVNALHRRTVHHNRQETPHPDNGHSTGNQDTVTTLACGPLVLNLLQRTATRDGQTIALLPQEFKLLRYLIENAGHVVTRTMILESVWGYHFDPQTNVIDSQISRLRKRIDAGFDRPILITVRGGGYMLSADH
ncbi:MAG: response regulator transcription factor [Alphaproteobacteria bacterium]|nr:response regulator transcription factor [Alphaproteobacteria bacterium]